MPRWRFTQNIATGNARVGMRAGDTSRVRGTYNRATKELTFTCPACGRGKVYRGDGFASGVREKCDCGNFNDVYI